MKLLIATHNPGKFKEIAALLEQVNNGREEKVEFVSLSDLEIKEDFEETADTFEGNSLGKAHFYSKLAGLPTVADDSGLFVTALAGELGVKTRRWGAGKEASDKEWLDYFMNRMEEEYNRKASFVCAAGLVIPADCREDGENEDLEKVFFGQIIGEITDTIEGPLYPGIPVSSVFKPEGTNVVFTNMTSEEKNHYSHRGTAFKEVLKYLLDYFHGSAS